MLKEWTNGTIEKYLDLNYDGLFDIMAKINPDQSVGIYNIKNKNGDYVFVHSRHTTMVGFGSAMPSQNYGYCKVHE